ncbi:MAG: glycosyltransferase [Candidatus Liptonbacteria bacterium]|nr:glycosyltransferase [Candidatus Liptonbacteria bacterium]
MVGNLKVSVVIPCRNEAESIAKVIAALPKEVDEIVVVDNGSTDDTARIAAAANARVIPESVPGYGRALKTGFAAATGDVIVTLDGDGQYPAEDTVRLVQTLQNRKLDFVSANRFPLRNKNALPWVRRFGNGFFTYVVNALFGLSLLDSQSGMWIFRISVLKRFKLVSDDMPLSEEIKIKAATNPGIKFGESPIDYRPRSGTSKLIPWKHGLLNLWFLLRLRGQQAYRSRTTRWSCFALLAILTLQAALTWWHIQDYFVYLSADVAGENGLAAWNWLRFGPGRLKFGIIPSWLASGTPGAEQYYTHHPVGFILPIYLSYLWFGVSELTTRLGTAVLMLFATVLFFFALRRIFSKVRAPFLILLVYILLPGTTFYGKSPELAVFSLPAALAAFSLFILYEFRPSYTRLVWFLIAVFLGGWFGWFFYFLPIAIWLYLLLPSQRKAPGRRTLLIALPVILGLDALLVLTHFYITSGGAALSGLMSIFGVRAGREPGIGQWFHDAFRIWNQNMGWPFVVAAVIGLILFLVQRKQRATWSLFTPLFLMPVLNALVFYQWSLHPFGFTFLLPTIAVLAGIFLETAVDQWRAAGWGVVGLILLGGAYISYLRLDYFYYRGIIIGRRDIYAIQGLAPQLKDWNVCLGRNEIGLNYRGIFEWYLKRPASSAPKCLDTAGKTAGFIMKPDTGPFYEKEKELFEEKGFKFQDCASSICVMVKNS